MVSVLIVAAILIVAGLGNPSGGPLASASFVVVSILLLTVSLFLWLLYSVLSVSVRIGVRLLAAFKRDILGTIGFVLAIIGAVWGFWK